MEADTDAAAVPGARTPSSLASRPHDVAGSSNGRAMQTQSDSALLAAHVARDPHAFNELGRRHRSSLTAVAGEILHHPQDADDAVQQAMLRAFRHAEGFQGRSPVYIWLRTITVNEATRIAAQRTRLADRRGSLEEAADVVDRASANAASAVEIDEALREALAALPEDFRTAFLLVTRFDRSIDQVAEIQDVSPGTVKSRVSRARKLLLQQLGVQQVLAMLRRSTVATGPTGTSPSEP